MKAIVIQSKSPKVLRLLARVAANMGARPIPLSGSTLKDVAFGELMNREKTGKAADKKKVLKMLK